MWKIIRASTIGTSHINAGSSCQDSCYADVILTADNKEYFVVLVSDGAGSAKEGGQGAELTCETAISCISTSLEKESDVFFTEKSIVTLIEDIKSVIADKAKADNLTAKDFACTFLGAVIGHSQSLFFQIGDGAIVLSVNNVQGVVFWPDSGEFANMTYFVTDKDALSNLHIQLSNVSFEEIAVFTDGIQRLALSFEQQRPHPPFFDPMFAVLRKQSPELCDALDKQLRQFLESPAVNERTDDDKTLVLATRLTA
ncbi:MAG: PP2C family serine/threonine-protein phosphatase [Methylococcales bacterium]